METIEIRNASMFFGKKQVLILEEKRCIIYQSGRLQRAIMGL